ncbi:MAG: hypothetical protein JSV82_02710 [Planctomycetota bacterium]|nr:MAG: hypothetical protein JSV82_02710 [Planctomycetota bacterium]
MRATTKLVSSEHAAPILQLKRALLPIDEYALREGISTEIIEKYAQLGIVQIRRFKDKIFVVDIPLSPYSSLSDAAKDALKLINNAAQPNKMSQLVQKIVPDTTVSEQDCKLRGIDIQDTIEEPAQAVKSVGAETISELVKKISRRTSKTLEATTKKIEPDFGRVDEIPGSVQVVHTETRKSTDQAAPSTGENTWAEILSEPIQPPDWEIFESPDEFDEPTKEDVKTQEILDAVQSQQDKSKRLWELAAIFLVIFFVAAVFANLWFYVDRQLQLGKLDLVYANIQKTQHDVTQANRQIENLKSRLADSRAEVTRFRRELDESTAQVKSIQDELTQSRENLRTIHRVNAGAIERFDEQIQELITMTE